MKPSRAISTAKLPPSGTAEPLLSQQTGERVWPQVVVEVLSSPCGPGPLLILYVGVEAGREISHFATQIGMPRSRTLPEVREASVGTLAPIG